MRTGLQGLSPIATVLSPGSSELPAPPDGHCRLQTHLRHLAISGTEKNTAVDVGAIRRRTADYPLSYGTLETSTSQSTHPVFRPDQTPLRASLRNVRTEDHSYRRVTYRRGNRVQARTYRTKAMIAGLSPHGAFSDPNNTAPLGQASRWTRSLHTPTSSHSIKPPSGQDVNTKPAKLPEKVRNPQRRQAIGVRRMIRSPGRESVPGCSERPSKFRFGPIIESLVVVAVFFPARAAGSRRPMPVVAARM